MRTPTIVPTMSVAPRGSPAGIGESCRVTGSRTYVILTKRKSRPTAKGVATARIPGMTISRRALRVQMSTVRP